MPYQTAAAFFAWPKLSSRFLLAVLVCVAAAGSAADSGVCQKCGGSRKCPKDMFCCPFQLHCIPKGASSCLCPNKGSSKSLLHNNERVWKGEKNCDGIKCEFCPGTNGPKNTCLRGNKDLCVAEGAQKQNAICVYGDHCKCSGGFVCSDTKKEGECTHGTGGYVFCEKKVNKNIDTNSTTTAVIVKKTTAVKVTIKATTITSSTTTTTTTKRTAGTCEKCKAHSQCQDGFYCCPNQRLCIPNSKRSCLCPDGTSLKSNLHNNERVFKAEKNCDDKLCEFCPGIDHPKNTCTLKGCRGAGASIDQGYCVHGDHCRCQNGFVCSNSLLEGMCDKGTGGFVYCVNKTDETTQKSRNTEASDPDASSTCTKHHLIMVMISIVGVTL